MTLQLLIIVFIMALAILFFLLEIFLLPGITFAGVAGMLFAVGGIAYAYTLGLTIGNITLAVSVFVFGVFFFWLLRANSFQRVALKTDVDARLTSTRELGLQVGEEGVALSRLAPIGKARFGNITVEAKASENFIDERTPVKIVQIDGTNVLVETIHI